MRRDPIARAASAMSAIRSTNASRSRAASIVVTRHPRIRLRLDTLLLCRQSD